MFRSTRHSGGGVHGGGGGAILFDLLYFWKRDSMFYVVVPFLSFLFSIDVRGIVGWVRSSGVKSAQATGGFTQWSGLAPKYCYCFAVFGLCVYSRSVNNSKLSDGELCVVCLVEFIAKKSRCESRGLFLSN